ncbi:MAG: SusC/RagA family TonB-linked outer membrane protein [Porphyromonas sp.]|nr:SusC/RagA family TonB-linked outer membrane protein [Porphyromonas sp.]
MNLKNNIHATRWRRQIMLSFLLMLLTVPAALAQKITVTGTVHDTDGFEVIGASIMVVGESGLGASTNLDGVFTIQNVPSDATLRVSYVGMKTQDISVNGRTKIDIVLEPDTELLDEVVVTALGIKREKRSLGYAIQEIKGEDLLVSRETNVTNALSGKIAGLQVIKGGGGISGSSKIVLRGNNSLTGDNQPLIVVDGVPMDNFTGASNSDFWNPSLDMGNGLGDLNPNDIASMSVLKGASAAALYGSRAGNGVILITTKTGDGGQRGMGVSFNSTTGFESLFMIPDVQKSYGQGSYGVFNPESTSSWGAKIEGQEVTHWDGSKAPLQYYDNIGNFLQTGVNTQNSVALSRQLGKGSSLYTSVTHTYNSDVTPESKLNRFNFITRFVSKFGKDDAWTVDAKVQYINTKVHNRPIGGNRPENFFGTLLTMPGNVDITALQKGIDDDGNHIWYEPSGRGYNPYWATKYNQNDDGRDRYLMNGSIKYQFTDWLSAEIRTGADKYTTNSETKTYAYGPIKPNGAYSVKKDVFSEMNNSFLISAGKDELFGDFGLHGTFGGNMMYRKFSSIGVTIGELEVPNLFTVSNSIGNPELPQSYSEHKINSLYGTLQFNYASMLYLDLTARNDWSSTLSKDNRSFFYPSISLSFIFSDALRNVTGSDLDWLTFAKIRSSYASVGNDMGPYQLFNTYSVSKDPNGNIVASKKDVLYDPNVKNELINSWELGLEAKLFDSRLNFDLAFYKSNAINQLLDIPINGLEGYKYRKINAGDIENKGFEFMIEAIPVMTRDFTWNINANLSKNVNTVKELAEDVTQYALGAFDNISVLAAAGERYGVIYGTKFARVEDEESPYYDQVIVDEEGIPMVADGLHYLGDQQPKFMLGVTNTITYKNLSMSFQIDGRFGGKMFSFTNRMLKLNGRSSLTAPNGVREDITYDGVREVDGKYVPNDVKTDPQDFWTKLEARGSGNVGITEDNLFDATNIRLRHLSVNYNLPQKWLEGSAVQGAKVGFSANNLWMIKSYLNGVDPESVFATGTNAVGLEALAPPTTRSYYINFSINF